MNDQVGRQSPTPTSGGEGSDLRSIANRIEGLLDEDGHFNPDNKPSRAHPDYDESTDERAKPQQQQRDNRGRFQKAAPAPDDGGDTEQADLTAEDDQPAASDDQEAETEQLEAGDTEEDQRESAETEAEEGEQDTGEPIQTLTELADALEIPIDELKGQINHTFRAAGEEVTVNLAELEAGYQKDADYRRQTGELAEQRRQIETDHIARMQGFEQQHAYTAHMMNVMEEMLIQDLNSDKLQALRASDPAEWTARREEIGQRVNAVQQARQSAAQQYDQFRFEQLKQLKERENASLRQKMPDFGTQHVQLATQTMASLGYGNDEIKDIFDHRLVIGALELATLREEVKQLRAEKTQAKDAVKRVKKTVPKFQKPGRQRLKGRKQVTRDNVARLRERARKSGSVQDAAKVIESMME